MCMSEATLVGSTQTRRHVASLDNDALCPLETVNHQSVERTVCLALHARCQSRTLVLLAALVG